MSAKLIAKPKELLDCRVAEINSLHAGVLGNMRRTVNDAIRIGELLTESKMSLAYGEWGAWVKQNLQFTDRTARRYMRFYQWRAQLTSDTMSELDLTDACLKVRTAQAEEKGMREAKAKQPIEIEAESLPSNNDAPFASVPSDGVEKMTGNELIEIATKASQATDEERKETIERMREAKALSLRPASEPEAQTLIANAITRFADETRKIPGAIEEELYLSTVSFSKLFEDQVIKGVRGMVAFSEPIGSSGESLTLRTICLWHIEIIQKILDGGFPEFADELLVVAEKPHQKFYQKRGVEVEA